MFKTRVRKDEGSETNRKKIGFFLDDERKPAHVTWCCKIKNVEWRIAKDYNSAIALVEKLIKEGVVIDYLALDYDLGEFNFSSPRTGETFFNWFAAKVRTLYSEGINVVSDDLSINIHSQAHPDMLHPLRRAVGNFESWLYVERYEES